MKKTYIVLSALLTVGLVSCGGDAEHSDSTTTTEEKTEVTETAEETVEETTNTADYSAGEEVYKTTCKACHQENGQGIVGVFPPLANSDYLLADKNRAIKQVLEGSSEEMVVNGETYNGTMTPQNLEDQQVVDVINYVLNSWGNDGGEVTLEDVQSQKGSE